MSEQQSSGRIVVGVDGSEQSKAALRWARRIAAPLAARIQAVTAWEYPTMYGGPMYVEDYRPDLDAEKVLGDTLDEVFPGDRPSDLEAVVRQGPPRQVLLQAAVDADLLVLGSRGHGGVAGLLLGSVSAHCAEHAPCAVLVARGEPPAAPPA